VIVNCIGISLICSRVFVNGRSRHLIMEDMKRKIERGDLKQEKADAIQVG
jgi:OHCU decarboxylase